MCLSVAQVLLNRVHDAELGWSNIVADPTAQPAVAEWSPALPGAYHVPGQPHGLKEPNTD